MCVFFFSFSLNPLPTACTVSLQAHTGFVTLPNLGLPSFFTRRPVSFFPVFPLFSFLSVFPLTTLLYLCCFMPPPLFSAPLPANLTASPFRSAALFSLTLSCLSHRGREAVRVDSCSSNFCSLIGQWWSGAAGERANHGVRPPAGWQWPEGKWSHPCLEIWPAFGYVLAENTQLFFLSQHESRYFSGYVLISSLWSLQS